MTGEQLYALYHHGEKELNNCNVDTWEELDDRSKAVWNYMAEVIRNEV